jgi:dihydroflavonol-4-reductase
MTFQKEKTYLCFCQSCSMIFVTGGTGLLGSHLLYALLIKGEKVRALKRETSGFDGLYAAFSFYGDNAQELAGRIEWVNGDLLDISSLQDALEGVTDVYHCAAKVTFDSKQKAELRKINVKGTANLIDACLDKGIRRLCHVSSIGALGSEESGGTINELSPRKSSSRHSAYSHSKYLGELEVWRGIAEGLDAVIINPSVIIGPGDQARGAGNLFGLVGGGLKYYTTGRNAYVDVRDVAEVMMLLMDRPDSGERYIVSSANMGYKELLELVAAKMGKDLPTHKAGKTLLTFASWAQRTASVFKGKPPLLTRDLVRILTARNAYSAHKLIEKTGFDFRPLNTTIADFAARL